MITNMYKYIFLKKIAFEYRLTKELTPWIDEAGCSRNEANN